MPLFDFSTPTTITLASFSGAFGTTSLSVMDTASGVNFTFSVVVSETTPGAGGGSLFLSAFAGGFTGTVTNTNSRSFDISVILSFTTTAARTAFTASPTVVGSGLGGFAQSVAGNAITYTLSSSASVSIRISEITANFTCFCAGTRIATPDGPRAIETLASGDRVLTADGTETTVCWLGRQSVPADQLHPQKVNPIRIRAGALGDNLPHQDLYVSPDHALELDGILINAGTLTNGTTITQVTDMPTEGFDYYHIETDAHELILAEGIAAETYLDSGDLNAFANLHERTAPDAPMQEMSLPRVSSKRLLPAKIAGQVAA